MKNNIINFISNRFLYSKKSQSLVNIISIITSFSIALVMAVLVFIMSIFNGFQNLIESQYSTFYPDIKITCKNNFFQTQKIDFNTINPSYRFSKVIEQRAVLKNNKFESVVTVLGVDSNIFNVLDLDSSILNLKTEKRSDVFVCSRLIADEFALQLGDMYNPCTTYFPNSDFTFSGLNSDEMFNVATSYPVSFFEKQSSLDAGFILMKESFVSNLISKKNKINAIYLKTSKKRNFSEILFGQSSFKKSKKLQRAKRKIQNKIGLDFKIETFFEQNQFLFKMIRIEKLAIYFLMSLVIILISFIIIGNLIILIVEKKNNIEVLKGIGFNSKQIIQIFKKQGQKLVLIGVIAGSFFGVFLVLLQQKIGFLKMGKGFIVDSYPVGINLTDLCVLFLIVISIGYFSVNLISKSYKKYIFN